MTGRKTIAISKIVRENETINTYYFEHDLAAKPGQFIMLTDLEHGEKPFSISECERGYFAVTIKKLGKFTENLFKKKVGDLLSFRGAYGSSFELIKGNILLVGGGYATPPLYFLTKELLRNGSRITFINGAKTKEDLVFCDRLQDLDLRYKRITDAGCFGESGTSVDVARGLLTKNKYDQVYVSGPEMMMSAMRDLMGKYRDTNYQFLFERYMKCAIGICGSCTIDPLGIRICVEGPVLNREQIMQLIEFGNYHRDAAGNREYFK